MRSDWEVENAITQFGDMIQRICFVHLQKKVDVEDVFQNVFFKYAQSDTDFLTSEHQKAWLIRIAINECHSLKRRFFHRHVVLSDDLSMYGMMEEPQHPEILQALFQLSQNYRNVIYLHYYEGYSLREIAQILQKKENTVATWHSRAKQQLKELLGGDDFEETII